MNKDGHKDIAIGGSRHGDYRGQAAVYCGGPGRSMDLIPDKLVEGEMSACYFGNQVRLADVNSDGFDDLLVGDWMYNSNQGRVYLYYGGPDK